MYLFIVNNQTGKGLKVWKKTLPILINMNINYKTYFTTSERDQLQISKDIVTNQIKAVIIIGGDGTIHHALELLKNTSIPIGVIPAGSGNDFARALNIPKNYKLALKKIIAGKNKAIDLIYVNETPCATVLSVGFDAKVTDSTNRSKIKKWLNLIKLGKFAYVVGVLREISHYQPTDVSITIDGQQKNYSNVLLIAIANTPFYGGGLRICPAASETDGLLTICVTHSLSRLELLLFFPLVFLGKHTFHRSVAILTGKDITLKSNRPTLVQADGEVIGETPITVNVKAMQLNVIV